MGLLALVPVKDWLYCGVIAAIIGGGFWYHHKLIEEGIADQRHADDIASAAIAAKTAKETADLQARAMVAEQSYDKERNENQTYRDSHPNEPVRLCISTPGRIIVSQGAAAHSGNANPGAAANSVQPVPNGDPSSRAGGAGPDIEPMLAALTLAADNVSAELREFQSRYSNGGPDQ